MKDPLVSFLLKTPRMLLLGGSGLLVFSLIYLTNIHVLPLDEVSFFFFSFVLFLLALYRPAWVFLLFVAVLPLEIISVLPSGFGHLALRPYQWLAGIVFLAVVVRFITERLPFRLFRLAWFDGLLPLVALGAFAALFNAPDRALALKQAVIVSSFVALYFLGRIFFRTLQDVRQAAPFFVLSSIIVLLYALWQNVRVSLGMEGFQVMEGRPNSTFSEADWLGLFTLVPLGISFAFLARALWHHDGYSFRRLPLRSILSAGLLACISFIVLLLSVARSAWLGALVLGVVFFLGFLFRNEWRGLRHSLPSSLWFGGFLTLSFSLAVGTIGLFHLSPFQFLNRIQSTGSGLQQITVSCLSGYDQTLPMHVRTVEELPSICTHIRLEDIEQEKQSGHIVYEVYRDDPNIAIRKQIYGDVWDILKKHPVFGIGWGNVALFLGNDEQGTALNGSNIFFEVWLGSGLIGVVSFVVFFGYALVTTFLWYRKETHEASRVFALFLLALLLGMAMFDLFNSGILLGFFFGVLSLVPMAFEWVAQSRNNADDARL